MSPKLTPHGMRVAFGTTYGFRGTQFASGGSFFDEHCGADDQETKVRRAL